MMLMAIDHIRDYVARSAQQFLPTDLTRTTPAIFFARWITHFSAPVFMLAAGIGAYFWMTRGHHSKSELSRLLISRGIWLIVLEVTILRLIFFSQISFTANPVILIILWAIGISMIIAERRSRAEYREGPLPLRAREAKLLEPMKHIEKGCAKQMAVGLCGLIIGASWCATE